MDDFNEAVLYLQVPSGMGEVYKKAIETENSPNGLKDHWNGNYAFVEIIRTEGNSVVFNDQLTITIISHTLLNLKKMVSWYESMGCEVVRTRFRKKSEIEENKNS